MGAPQRSPGLALHSAPECDGRAMEGVMEAINDKPTRKVRRGEWDEEPTARVIYLPATLRRFYDSADVYEALESAVVALDNLESEENEHGD